jgi:NADH-dependent peroxiredoxin subunit F
MLDLLVIGAGPAGITAAVYASRKRMKTLVLSKTIGGQAALSWDVENYTGYQFITGPELAKKFEEHLRGQNIESHEGITVTEISKREGFFEVRTPESSYQSRCVLIATGRKPTVLGVPGEKEFLNKGVTYCATCDAPIFQGKEVVVVGGGNSALDAAIQLMEIASKVSIVNIAPELTGDPILCEKVRASIKVQIFNSSEVKEIRGEHFANNVIIHQSGKEIDIGAEGVFIEIGSGPSLIPVKEAELKISERKEIIVNEQCETSVPGIFAAGDVTTVPVKQIIVAAGQGCIACMSAFRYLSRNKFK